MFLAALNKDGTKSYHNYSFQYDSITHQLFKNDCNISIRNQKIIKRDLTVINTPIHSVRSEHL